MSTPTHLSPVTSESSLPTIPTPADAPPVTSTITPIPNITPTPTPPPVSTPAPLSTAPPTAIAPTAPLPAPPAPNPAKMVDYEAEQRSADPTRFVGCDFFVEAMYDYSAQSDLETHLVVGDRFHVFEHDTEGRWYHGHGADPKRMGWFPATFCKPVDSL